MHSHARLPLLGLLAVALILFALPPVLAGGDAVSASCPRGQSIRAIASDGQAVCNRHPIYSTSNSQEQGAILQANGTSETVARLNLARGAYFIIAKAQVGPDGAGNPVNRAVECVLRAGTDSDAAIVETVSDGTSHANFTLTVVHTFGPKSILRRARLTCRMLGEGTIRKSVTQIKLTAMQGASRVCTVVPFQEC
jgi:hypothetical protein